MTTEGDQILGSAGFRSATGITGQGISVGVISDGDTHISTSQKSGDLPASIVDDPNDAGSFKSSGDEGTAMMEIVYDLAPGVKQLGFCGPQSTVDFITCLDDFANNIDANIIVDDLAFPGGAMFSDDDFTKAVQAFSTTHPNTRLVAATGNDSTAYWQGTWQPMVTNTTTPVNGVTYTQVQNFDTSGGQTPYLTVTVPAGDQIAYIVEWNDPWSDSATANDPNDYDVVVFDNQTASSSGGAGNLAVACNQRHQHRSSLWRHFVQPGQQQKPYEYAGATAYTRERVDSETEHVLSGGLSDRWHPRRKPEDIGFRHHQSRTDTSRAEHSRQRLRTCGSGLPC